MVEQMISLLAVDDDADNLDLIERTFRDRYEVIRAQDGVEALAIIKNRKIDVIITDQRMPDMRGTELLEKALAITPKSVRIILSAYTETADILSAINVCRISHYLLKPVTPEKLRETVACALALVAESDRYGA